ncbi:MAG TPA: RDD family protein [Burkholderiales bacterium]|nr:RDD family protein [Burkholderiales bacterium]
MSQVPTALYPSLFRRFAGLGYEGLVVAAIVLAGGFAFAGGAVALKALFGAYGATAPGAVERVSLQILLAALLGAYFVRSWTRGGQTLAMKAWQLRVVRPDGHGIDARRALARFALAGGALGSGLVAALWLWRHPASIAGWFAILPATVDVAWAIGDRDRQFLHDRLSGTRVVRIDPAA